MTTPKATLIMLDPTSDVYTFCENDQLHESVFHTIVEDDSTAECNQENWQLLQHVVINSPHSIERSIASEKEQDLKESVESEQLKLSRSDTPNKLFSDNLRDLAQTNEYQEMTNMPSEVTIKYCTPPPKLCLMDVSIYLKCYPFGSLLNLDLLVI